MLSDHDDKAKFDAQIEAAVKTCSDAVGNEEGYVDDKYWFLWLANFHAGRLKLDASHNKPKLSS